MLEHDAYWLSEGEAFPPITRALSCPNGLLAIGGDLSPDRLYQAYYSGIFPWFGDDEPILWWSPDPRAVFSLDTIHVSRSLQKFMRKMPYQFTINHCFAEVMQGCAANRAEGSWISDMMCEAYQQLHQQGLAHSIEVWQQGELVGGLYGVGMGRIFCGESMFSQQSNASKCAFVMLCRHLRQHDFAFIDSQILNDHTFSLGAIEISRDHYLAILSDYRDQLPATTCWQKQVMVQ